MDGMDNSSAVAMAIIFMPFWGWCLIALALGTLWYGAFLFRHAMKDKRLLDRSKPVETRPRPETPTA